MRRINVIKPFSFSAPGKGERRFPLGEHELADDDPLFEHRLFKKPDGVHLETPEQAVARLTALVAQHRTAAKSNDELADMYAEQLKALGVEPVVKEPAPATLEVEAHPPKTALAPGIRKVAK
jgi:hypothetical protein